MKAIAYDSHTIPEIWDIIHVDLKKKRSIYIFNGLHLLAEIKFIYTNYNGKFDLNN